MGIEFQEDEEQDGKSPEGGTSVAEEGQWDSDHGEQPYRHADVHGKMEK